jgi:hypothetical protein
VSAVKSLLHRARATLAHSASLPAFAAPLLARLPRLRAGQLLGGLVAEHATGAATIATVALAGTSALGSLHVPASPAAPTAAQSRAALVAAARQPRPRQRVAPGKHRDSRDTQDLEYGPAAGDTLEYGP